MKTLRTFCLCLGLALAGCRLGNPSEPAPLPGGVITGLVVSGGPVAGATVQVSGPGGLLGRTRTDASGAFRLPLATPSATLTVVVSGGSYTEPTHPGSVSSGRLSGTFAYHAGHTLTVAVTPITTAACALAQDFVREGYASGPAEAHANDEFAAWLDFAPATTDPVLLDALPAGQTFDASLRYGLILAALSRWAVASGSTTRALTRTMVADLAFDGRLNGQGAQGLLTLGSLTLSATAYADALADALM